MLGKKDRGVVGARLAKSVHCQECTIQIGDGYQESRCFEFRDDSFGGRLRVLKVCWRCWESLNRRRMKRLAEAEKGASPQMV
jgi:hypothetical protein